VTGPGGTGNRTWAYDSRQLLSSETHPESGTTSYQYDSAGLLTLKTDARSVQFSYSYDGDGRPTSVVASRNANETTTFTYRPGLNELGSVSVSAQDGLVTTAFVYDSAGRVTTRTETVNAIVPGAEFEVRYEYDSVDNLTAVTYPSGRKIGYEYDSEGRITRVFYPGASGSIASEFQYHPSGAMTAYRAGNGVLTTVAIDSLRYWVNSITIGTWQLTYGHDAVGNVTSIGDTRSAHNQSMTYDAVDRLKTANGVYGSMVFDYDAQGNRVSGSTGTYGYSGNRLTSFNGMPMTYDAVGNLLTEGAQASFTYRGDNLPSQVVVGATITRFLYDADQWRVRKATDGQPATHYVRGAGGQLLSEWRNTSVSGAIVRDYVYAGSRLLAVWTSAMNPK
jgi:YD repeat-containing protein